MRERLYMALSSENDLPGHLGTGSGNTSYNGLTADQESTKPALYSKLPKTSTQAQPPKDNMADHMGTPVKPIPQPVPTSNTSAGLPYSEYDY